MIRFLAVLIFLPLPLGAEGVARDIPGGMESPTAVSPMNLGVELPPMEAGFLPGTSRAPGLSEPNYSLTPAAPNTTVPRVISPGIFSSMPLGAEISASPAPLPGKNTREGVVLGDVKSSRSASRFAQRLNQRALGLQNPLKNLVSWNRKGNKNSAERGRHLSDDLWNLLFKGSLNHAKAHLPLPAISREWSAIFNSAAPRGLDADQTKENPPSSGQDPVVRGIGEIPSPVASYPNSRTRASGDLNISADSSFAGSGFSNLAMAGMIEIGRAPALIFMRVARRLLDFTLFKQMGGLYRVVYPDPAPAEANWNFFEPTRERKISTVRELGTVPNPILERPDFNQAELGTVPNSPNSAFARKIITVPDHLLIFNTLADWWLFLSFLPIFIAAFAYRRSFL